MWCLAVVVGAGVALAVHRKSGGKGRRVWCAVKVFHNSLSSCKLSTVNHLCQARPIHSGLHRDLRLSLLLLSRVVNPQHMREVMVVVLFVCVSVTKLATYSCYIPHF